MNGHRVRVAQTGWNVDRPAETLDDVTTGLGVEWVEIDGHRFDRVISATVVASKDAVTLGPWLVVQVVGPVEIVYVDSAGAELGAVETDVTPKLEHGTALDRPDRDRR